MLSIGDYAFDFCYSISSITIPNSVTSIGNYAFNYCTGLTSIAIPSSVTSIEASFINGCYYIVSIKVDANNAKYDSRNNCNAIIETATNTLVTGCRKTTIPNSVIAIGNSAFENCLGLTSITIPNSVTSIGDYAFAATRLFSIIIPSSVTSIGDNAFTLCSDLTSITIPNSVTSIGEYAFSACLSLKTLTIGSGIKYIKKQSFAGCPKLNDVYCYAVSVPITNNDAFDDSYIESMTLHVPSESIDAYKTTNPWMNFKDIVALTDSDPKPDATGINVVWNPKDSKAVIYNLNGVRLSEPQKGINIINGKKYVKK